MHSDELVFNQAFRKERLRSHLPWKFGCPLTQKQFVLAERQMYGTDHIAGLPLTAILEGSQE
jgi:hypothetical protein